MGIVPVPVPQVHDHLHLCSGMPPMQGYSVPYYSYGGIQVYIVPGTSPVQPGDIEPRPSDTSTSSPQTVGPQGAARAQGQRSSLRPAAPV